MTKNQRIFQQELQRLQRSINRLLKQDKYIPLYNLPEQPRRITKRMLKVLHELKGRQFVEEINIETGEIIHTPKEQSLYKRKPKARKYLPDYSVYQDLLERFQQARQEIISQYNIPSFHELVDYKLRFIGNLISTMEYKHSENGNIYIAYLQKNSDRIAELLTPLIYSSSQSDVDASYTELLLILRQDTAVLKEEFMEDISQYTESLMESGEW